MAKVLRCPSSNRGGWFPWALPKAMVLPLFLKLPICFALCLCLLLQHEGNFLFHVMRKPFQGRQPDFRVGSLLPPHRVARVDQGPQVLSCVFERLRVYRVGHKHQLLSGLSIAPPQLATPMFSDALHQAPHLGKLLPCRCCLALGPALDQHTSARPARIASVAVN